MGMESPRALDLHPAALPSGTLIGSWRVVARRGRGVYGAVYCAVKVGQEQAGLVALKLAVHESDPRFQREVELLSRIRHPSVPRLRDHGEWRSSDGCVYPYLVMEWVEGVALYDWCAAHNPSSRQVLRALAQVARALQATHEAGGVHRDVKGDNVLVREGDGRAMLLDFGAGHHTGASLLTWEPLPPGTPTYRSPEAWQFSLRSGRRFGAHYAAQAADDLFALGITAYRLVTEEYPPPLEPREDDEGRWYIPSFSPRPPKARNPRVDSRLSELILKLLSVDPEARGTARELAEALEQAAGHSGAELDEPLFQWETRERSARPTDEAYPDLDLGYRPQWRELEAVRAAEQREAIARARASRLEAEEHARARAPTEKPQPTQPRESPSPARLLWGAMAAGALLLIMRGAMSGPGTRHWEPVEEPRVTQTEASDGGTADGGVAGLGDAALPASVSVTMPMSHTNISGLDVPTRPFKGQRQPPCGKSEAEIRGGCWIKLETRPPDCPEYAYAWNSNCYIPIMPPQRPATSTDP
jgi:serine/threonine protein kinase